MLLAVRYHPKPTGPILFIHNINLCLAIEKLEMMGPINRSVVWLGIEKTESRHRLIEVGVGLIKRVVGTYKIRDTLIA